MNIRVIIISLIIFVALIFGTSTFIQSNIEYGTFKKAMLKQKKIQVKGEWVREEPTSFDLDKGQFIFSMRDEEGTILPVIFTGVKPNNFEIAPSIVVKGKYFDNHFLATEILTKCPSKYETNLNR